MSRDKQAFSDIRGLQDLVQTLHRSTGVSIAIMTPHGQPLASSGWSEICQAFQGTGREAQLACQKTRTTLKRALKSGTTSTITQCPLGLSEAVAPITNDGKRIAYLFIGQCLPAAPRGTVLTQFKAQASLHGLKGQAHVVALKKLAIIQTADMEALLVSMAHLIGAALRHRPMEARQQPVDEDRFGHRLGNCIPTTLEDDRHQATDTWSATFDAINDAVALIDPEGRILKANKAMAALSGKPMRELIGHFCFNVVHGTSEPIPGCPHQTAKQTQRRESLDMHMGERYYQVTVDPILDESGRMSAGVHIITDITERKQVENTLRESEARFRSLIQNSSDLIVILNAQGLITYATPSIDRVLGYPPGSLIGISPLGFIHPDDLPTTHGDLKDVYLHINDGLPTEFRFKKADGSWVYLEAIGNNLLEYQGINGVVITARDISERKQAEIEISQASQRYKDLVETTNDFFWEVGPDWAFTYTSPKCRDFLGYDSSELKKKPALDYMSRGEVKRLWNAALKKLEHGEAVNNFEHTFIMKEGRTTILESSILPVFNGSGAITGYRGVSRDITERKRLEDELTKVQKLDSIGTLAGGIAHDYNNLLTAILGYIGLCKSNLPPADPLFELIEKAEKASLSARDLTKQLITFSRGGLPLRKVLDIRDLIKQTVKFSLSGSKLKPHYTFGADLAPVYVDEDQLRQVIQNLVINAREAMQDNGNLAVEVADTLLEPNNTYSLPPGDYIRISINDTGKGIPAELLPRVFDPYFSTKELGSQKGMGLGLSICYSIIKKHGGGIDLASKVGAGTTASVFLPAVKS